MLLLSLPMYLILNDDRKSVCENAEAIKTKGVEEVNSESFWIVRVKLFRIIAPFKTFWMFLNDKKINNSVSSRWKRDMGTSSKVRTHVCLNYIFLVPFIIYGVCKDFTVNCLSTEIAQLYIINFKWYAIRNKNTKIQIKNSIHSKI